jgi:hypothetical protein
MLRKEYTNILALLFRKQYILTWGSFVVQVHGEFSLAEVLAKFSLLRDERVLKSEEFGWGAEKPVQVRKH